LPYRIKGTFGVDRSDADVYLSARPYTFVRTSMALALNGEYDFIEGVVLTLRPIFFVLAKEKLKNRQLNHERRR